jgi:hypothetical protein
VFTSQPLVGTPSQFANPGSHDESEHDPDAQDSVAWARLHVDPQAPQLVRVVSGVSQPSPASPLQSPKPVLHVETPHTPATQFGVPPATGHTFPQVPQLPMLVAVLVSHPLFGFPSQLPNPELQTGAHTPAAHVFVPLLAEHTTPHAPQLVAVVIGVSQPFFGSPSQFANPAAQTGAHTPATQLVDPCPLVQVEPQAPQAAAVVWMFVSQPLVASPSQLA